MINKISPSLAIELNSALETARLVIEPLTHNHSDTLFEIMQKDAIYEWMSSTRPRSAEKFKQWWQTLENRLDPEGNVAWLNWMVRRSSDGAYIGKIDANVSADKIATNVGYFFSPEHWGNGYATESVLAVSDFLMKSGISKMFATVTEGNLASYRILEKAGFIRTRTIPENEILRGVQYNSLEFVRTS